MQDQFPCPQCGNPLAKPCFVENILFEDNLQLTMDLLESRINTVICSLCKEKITFQAPLLVIDQKEKEMLALLPKASDEAETELHRVADEHNLRLQICRNYNELRAATFRWIDKRFTPVMSTLLSDEANRLTLEQKVTLVTTFFLRIYKASLDGFLPRVLHFESDGPPEQLDQIGRASCRERV